MLSGPAARITDGSPELGQVSARRCKDQMSLTKVGLLDQGRAVPAELAAVRRSSASRLANQLTPADQATSRDAAVAAARPW